LDFSPKPGFASLKFQILPLLFLPKKIPQLVLMVHGILRLQSIVLPIRAVEKLAIGILQADEIWPASKNLGKVDLCE
jgi:hypothetical protein